jgi:hypothetical protein
MASKTQVVPTENGSAEVSTALRPHQILQRQLAMEASAAAREFNGMELAIDAVDRIADASTIEDLWAANDTGGLESLKTSPHLHNIPLTITEYRPVKGDDAYEENSLGYFAVFQAIADTGETHAVSCGAPQIVAMLAKLDQMSAWPQRVIFRAKSTVKGRERLTIEQAPAKK